MLRAFWRERSAVLQLFQNDFVAKTRGVNSSSIWNYVMPVVPIGFYVLLSSLSIFPDVEGMSRLTFVSIGVLLWLLFSGIIINTVSGLEPSIRALESNRLSVLSNLVSRLSNVLFDTFVRIVIVAIAISFFVDDALHISALVVPVFFIAVLCCFGVGLFFAILSVAFGDLAKIITIFLQYGIFVSGVIFPLDRLGWLADYAALNPLYLAIDCIRSLLVLGSYTPSLSFYAHIGLGAFVLLWSLAALSVLKDSLRGRL